MANELHTACEEGNLEKVKALIANDSSLINQPHLRWGTYPIFFAAQKSHFHIVQYLLTLPPTQTVDPCSSWKNLLFYSCTCKNDEKRLEMLQFIYANIELCRFGNKVSKLHVAAALGDIDYCTAHQDKLLQFTDDNLPPIFYSLMTNQQKIIELVFKQESDLQHFIFTYLASQKSEILDKEVSIIKYIYTYNKYTSCFIETVGLHIEKVIATYKESIATLMSINDKTDKDRNLLDEYHRKLAKSYFEYITVLDYKKVDFVILIDTCKNALAALEKVKEKTDKDKDIFDNLYRKLANTYNRRGVNLCDKKNYSEAVPFFENALAVLEDVREKTDEDKNLIDRSHRALACSYNAHCVSLYNKGNHLEAVTFIKLALAAFEMVNEKTNKYKNLIDRFHRDLANAYNRHGLNLYNKENYLEAVTFIKHALAAFEKVNEKTDRDKNLINRFHRDLAKIHNKHGITLYNIGENYLGAEYYLKESIELSNKINDKLDRDYIDNAICFVHLAKIYSSFHIVDKHVDPVKYFHNAIKELSSIKSFNKDFCEQIKWVYISWQSYYLKDTCEWHLTKIAGDLFSPFQTVQTFDELFLPLNNKIKNAPRLSENFALAEHLIQLMELLLKVSENNTLDPGHNLLGVKYLSDSKNKQSFKDKLNELKNMSDPSLARELEHHPSTMMAILSEMKTMKNNIEQLKMENQLLKAALLSSTSQTSLPSTTHLAPSSIGPENTALPATTPVQTTIEMAAVSYSSTSTISSFDNNSSMWRHKRKNTDEENTGEVVPQSNNTVVEKHQDQTAMQIAKKRPSGGQ